MIEKLPFEEIKKITFSDRPVPIPTEFRVTFKVIQVIILIKGCGRSDKISLLQLHFLNWLLQNPSNIDESLKQIESDKTIGLPFTQLDPVVNSAIDYAIGSDLLSISTTGMLCLTNKAINLLLEIDKIDSLLSDEKGFVAKVGKTFSDKQIRQILK